MRIYTAARFSRIKEVRAYCARLVDLDHQITSNWVYRTDENLEDLYSAEAPVIAAQDIEDVLSANCLILFSDPPRSTNSRSGKEVEFGIGIGTERHRLILCGPRSNIFHAYDGVEDYPTFAALDAQLTRERDEKRDILRAA